MREIQQQNKLLKFWGFVVITFILLSQIHLKVSASSWTFEYTGSTESWTCPATGYYKLETWGAQGGGECHKCEDTGHFGGNGGYGAYASGEMYITEGTTLYISCGPGGEYMDMAHDSRVTIIGEDKYDRDHQYLYTPFNVGYTYCSKWDGPDEDWNTGSKQFLTISGGPTCITKTNTQYQNTAAGNIIIAAGAGTNGDAYCTWDYDEECSDDGYKTGGAGSVLVNTLSNQTNTSGVNGHKNVAVPDGEFNCKRDGWPGHNLGACYSLGCIPDTPYEMKGKDGYAKITALHNHTYTWVTTTAATCTKAGSKSYKCTGTSTDAGCGHVQKTEAIPVLGHAWPSSYSYATNNGIANGLKYKNCTRAGCGVRLQSQYLIVLNKGKGISGVSGGGVYKLANTSATINATVKPGYTWKNWTGTLTSTTKNYTFNMPAKAISLTANATPNTNTPYKVNHWVQKVSATSTEQNETNYELVLTENKTGTTDTSVTPPVKSYEGCISPAAQTVNINGDGSTVVNYYYTRIMVSLEIDGEYLAEHFDITTDLCTFDVYINDILVADDETDYFNDQILYGSVWRIYDINPVEGKHYTGTEVDLSKEK